MVEFHTAVVRLRVAPNSVAVSYGYCIVRHVSEVGVLFAPSKKPTFQKLSNVSMCIQSVAG